MKTTITNNHITLWLSRHDTFRCGMSDEPETWICDECDSEHETEDEANECCKEDETEPEPST